MVKDQIKIKFDESAKHYRLLEKQEEKFILTLSVLRFFTFAGGLILSVILFTANAASGIISFLLFSALFLFLLKLFSIHSEKREFLGNMALINQNESDALSGNLTAFNAGTIYTDPKHDFSFDIDLFGSSSVFQYLNRTVTGYGRDILASWLSDPYPLSRELKSRQEAVKELALKIKWRQEFMAIAMSAPLDKEEISGLLKWTGEYPFINSSRFRPIFINSLAVMTVLSLILVIPGLLPYQVFVALFLINLLHITMGLKKINAIHNDLSRKYRFLSSLNGMLKSFESETFASPVLNEIKVNISGMDVSAAVSVKKLGSLIQAFDTRSNQIVGVILNGLLLWDYQSIIRLEKWKSKYSNLFPEWLEMIGKADALTSLANYASNNPGFTYPSISDNSNVFSAVNIGHQLIDESKRVCNNFSLGKKGTICIISGANMAGKSTFLRTIAVNYILGMTGAPVCADEMFFMPGKLFTSMRTMDSLSANESYFYAELRRLNELKEKIRKGEPVFFILDEILKGTNSEDKSNGSKLYLQRIISGRGTGLLATHDTSLGKMENDYPGVIINKCFEIEIEGENIRFDYKIQDGITQKMNAVLLMRQMGILD